MRLFDPDGKEVLFVGTMQLVEPRFRHRQQWQSRQKQGEE